MGIGLEERIKKEIDNRMEEWRADGLSTERADKYRTERAIYISYDRCGLYPPDIVWCDSPYDLIKKYNSFVESLCEESEALIKHIFMFHSLIDHMYDFKGYSVGAGILGAAIAIDYKLDSEIISYIEKARRELKLYIWDFVGKKINECVDDLCSHYEYNINLRFSARRPIYGQHDIWWLLYYDVLYNILGIKEYDIIKGLILGAKSHGWWLPCRRVCFVAERHTTLKLNDKGRLHNDAGAAVAYPDGYEIYAWNGTIIPKEWILDKDSLTPDIALAWRDTKQRKAACEIIGLPKKDYLNEED